MKTSNKLLTLLLAIALIVPPIVMLSFTSAIHAGRFTVKNYNNSLDQPFKTLKPFKAVKIEGMGDPSLLQCNIEKGNSFGYTYLRYMSDQKGDADTAKLSYNGDTLFIRYNIKPGKIRGTDSEPVWTGGNAIMLSIPADVAIAADMATVSFGSGYKYSPLDNVTISLTNMAHLNVYGTNPQDGTEPAKDIDHTTATGTWNIHALDATIEMNGLLKINQLNMEMRGYSNFTLPKSVTVDSIRATASGESMINAPYNIIKKF